LVRILFVGDVVGKPGRLAAIDVVPRLRDEVDADIVIANGENAAGGLGITSQIAASLLDDAGIDVITLGNHAWSKREAIVLVESEPRVLRAANHAPGTPGRGVAVFDTRRGPVAVALLLGRVFMDPVDDPFRAALAALAEVRRETVVTIIDIHAEASSEKQALAWYLDGQVTAVVGTHTHVQTADERVLPQGTAFITDVGMTGPDRSIIGMSIESAMPRFTSSIPSRFEVASGSASVCAVVVEADEKTGLAQSITRLRVPPGSS
jgi:2',3'-cyclic-nucleotide 2'-phosphodiesterase